LAGFAVTERNSLPIADCYGGLLPYRGNLPAASKAPLETSPPQADDWAGETILSVRMAQRISSSQGESLEAIAQGHLHFSVFNLMD
jgi:hypothetical protein